MADLLIVMNWLLPLLYLALLIEYGAAFFLRAPRRGGRWRLPAVWGLHAAFLLLLGAFARRPIPANNYEVLSVVAASMTAVYWVVEYASGEWRTGGFVLLAAFLMQYTASVFLPGADLTSGVAGSTGRPAGFHVIPSILAYAALTIAAIYGLLHLIARRNLKRRRFGVLFDRLPSLDLLGTMNWHALLTGFVFMTLAMASGAAMYLGGGHSSPGGPDAKIWTKILAGAAAGKWLGRWAPERVSLISVVGFLFVAAILVASMILS